MKERPILFSGPMVRAIIEGQKTQTRRGITRLLKFGEITEPQRSSTKGYDWTFRDRRGLWNDISHARLLEGCPYGRVGDRLWVREAFYESGHAYQTYPEDDEWKGWAGSRDFRYVADGTPECRGNHVWDHDNDNDKRAREGRNFFPDRGRNFWRKRPSIHMPRRASRITLEITDIRVERLQDISDQDVCSEGLEATEYMPTLKHRVLDGYLHAEDQQAVIVGFSRLWESINGPGSWDANPLVWVITFKRVEVSK